MITGCNVQIYEYGIFSMTWYLCLPEVNSMLIMEVIEEFN